MKKRILFIDEDPGRAGSTVSLEYLVQGFNKNDYEVFVLTSKKTEQTKSILKESAKLVILKPWLTSTLTLHLHFTYKESIFSLKGFFLVLTDIIKIFIGIILLTKKIKLIKPDLIYLNEYSIIQASIVSSLLKIPSIVHIRSLMLTGSFGLRKYFLSKLILCSNKKVFAITTLEAKQLNPNKNQLNKIQVIPEFFPVTYKPSLDKDIIKNAFNIPLKKKIITMLGGILDIKGSLIFLQAAVEVLSKFNNVIFVLAGKNYIDNKVRTKYFNQCMYFVDILKKANAIVLLGEITNPLELVEISDILISPSTETHFPRPVIEAWGYEKPVIVAETDHTTNLIKHGENGLLFIPSDYHKLTEYMIELLESKDLRTKLGINGKRIVLERYNAEKNIGCIINHCNSLLNE